MKRALCLLAVATGMLHAEETTSNRYVSMQQEIRQAIARGNAYLKSQQKPTGNWDTEETPAFTALALTAAMRDPGLDRTKSLPEHLDKGFRWLLQQQKEDGGIYNKGLSTYNTATAVTALVSANNRDYEPAIVKGRNHLIHQQWDSGEKGKSDNPSDGGVGYGAGTDKDYTDLSNTYLAIEAISLSKDVVGDDRHGNQPDLDWKAASTFLSRCQNLKETNDQDWVSDDAKNKGGFIYKPGDSKSGKEDLPEGKSALRSYGSMSYAGLLSMIYANVTPDDPRVVAVKEWLGKNYTVDENPGMGAQGQYYYYQTMSKALSAANIDQLKLQNGKTADWKSELANKILQNQRSDGSWANSNGRWMESNPVLVTAYTVMTLEQIDSAIPKR